MTMWQKGLADVDIEFSEFSLLCHERIAGLGYTLVFHMPERFPAIFQVTARNEGTRLDQFLVEKITDVSRARVQQLIEQQLVLVNEKPAKASLRLRAGEQVSVLGPARAEPLRAIPEAIPLDVVYEDDDLAVINKP